MTNNFDFAPVIKYLWNSADKIIEMAEISIFWQSPLQTPKCAKAEVKRYLAMRRRDVHEEQENQ